jgi:ABC-type transport system involved in cytochrome bd biosynthesis fused ATPase/permease subunit
VTDTAHILQKCDEIILFDNGYINAVDNYHNLIDSSNIFKSLVHNEINELLKLSKFF